MPCPSWGISAARCRVGMALARREGTVCSGCYAMKGTYGFTNVQEKLEESRGVRRPGAPIGTRMKFITPKATVSLSFRRKRVELEDIIEVLDHAKRQAKEEESAR